MEPGQRQWPTTTINSPNQMTIAEMATYAYDQIDQARTELSAVSE